MGVGRAADISEPRRRSALGLAFELSSVLLRATLLACITRLVADGGEAEEEEGGEGPETKKGQSREEKPWR